MTVPQHTKNDSIAACPAPENVSHQTLSQIQVEVKSIDDQSSDCIFSSKEEFDWSPKIQGLILGSFFYGYVLTQIIGGKTNFRSI